jgi:hypothetical protein
MAFPFQTCTGETAMLYLRGLLIIPLFLAQATSNGTDASPPSLQTLSPNLARLSGVEPTSEITYVRLFLLADPPAGTPATFDLNRPTLTGQCTQDRKGKLHFELFVNFGNITDTAFYPPWRPTLPTDNFPPPIEKVTVTMEFLGYTHFKPAKRQFEKVLAPYGQLRYNNPAVGSSNMEDFAYYLQVLRSLPTLRLSAGPQTATFLTTPLLSHLHNEPLCRASGL